MLRAILLATILAGPAVAQTDAGTGDNRADQASGTLADPGPAAIHDGWTRHAVFGLTFAMPPDWKVLRESDDAYVLVAPGFAPRQKKGLAMGVQLLEPDDFREQFLEDETFARLLAADDRPALPVGPGIGFDRFTARPEQTGKGFATEAVISRYRHPEDGHLLVNFIAFDPARLATDAGLVERIFATLRLAGPERFKAQATIVDRARRAAAASQGAASTLGGLVTIRTPEGWKLEPGAEEATLRTETVYSAYVTLRRGDRARSALGMGGLFQGPPRESAGEVLGQSASVFSGMSPYTGMQVGTDMQRGKVRVYLLRTCLPDGSPVTVETSVAPGWLKDNDLDTVLDAITAHWPENMEPCHPAVMARANFAMGGLFAYVLPDGFKTGRSRSSLWIRTIEGPYASLSVGKGSDSFPSDFQLASSNPTGNGFVAPPQTRRAEIMGEPAMLFTGRGGAGEGTRMRQVALLDRCLPAGEPVIVEMRADDTWLNANGARDTLLAQKWLFMPEDAQPCDPSLLQTAMEVSDAGTAPEAEGAGAAAPPPAAPAPTEALIIAPALDDTPPKPAERASDDTPSGWVRHEKFGISAALPPDWTVRENTDSGFVATSAEAEEDNRLRLGLKLLPGETAEAIISQKAVRETLLASDVEARPLGSGIEFLKFIIDQEALGSNLSMVWLMSGHNLDGRGHPVVAIGTKSEAKLRARMTVTEQILATVRIVDPADFKARGKLFEGGFKPEQTSTDLEGFAAAWAVARPRVAPGATPEGWTRYQDNGVSVAVPDFWHRGAPENGMTIVNPATKTGIGIQTMDADTAKKVLEKAKFFSNMSVSDIRPVELAPGVVFLGFIPDPAVFKGVDPGYWLLSRRNLPGIGHPLIVMLATGEAPVKTLKAELQTLVDIFATARLVDPQDFRDRGIPVGRDWQAGKEMSGTKSARSPVGRAEATDEGAPAREAGPDVASAEIVFWQSIVNSDDPADFEAYLRAYPDGIFAPLARNRLAQMGAGVNTVSAPSPLPSTYDTPARGTAQRAALMDAARVPVQRELGQPVIFKVEGLRSDGNWAYLEATPLQPDGSPLDWSRTPMADAWAADMMSDLVLVVMRRDAHGWQAVDYVIGPTDVAWLNWVDKYDWPRALFTD